MSSAIIRQQYSPETLKEMVSKAHKGTPQDFSYQDLRQLEIGQDERNGERIDLSESNLSFANFSEMELGGIVLTGCNLRGANLSGCSLCDGFLDKADLTDANLENSMFVEQFLSATNFTNANLSGVNFAFSQIGSDCIWTGANLTGAYCGYYQRTDIKIMMEKPPLIVDELYVVENDLEIYLDFNIYVLDKYIRIGCQTHSYKNWLTFDEKKIEEIGGFRALNMFKDCRDFVVELADAHGCSKD